VIRLHELDRPAVLNRQAMAPARVYVNDPTQNNRIRHAREEVKRILLMLKSDYVSTAHTFRTIVELGANSCDISGQFSMGHRVHVWEISPTCIEYITRNFPWVKVHAEDLEDAQTMPADVLILCEVLEHLTDPDALVKKWLPEARYALISSPLEGDLTGDLSGGEHVWSFKEQDFQNFAKIGGHEVQRQFDFQMGQYRIKMMCTKRKEGSP
jgi:hypothetical protein